MSDYNKDNAKGRYIPDRDEFATQYMPGDWSFDFDGEAVVAILLSTPDGSPRGTFVRLPLTGNGWQWDGNKEAPTLSPSIDRHAVPNWRPGWHGFMRAGALESV